MSSLIMKKSKNFGCDILNIIDRGLIFITGACLIVLTLLIFFDVFLRYLLNSPLPATTEISELIMPYIGLSVLSYALYTSSHIRITFLTDKTSGKVKTTFDLACNLSGLIFSAFVTWGSWKFFYGSFVIREEMLSVIKLPYYLGKFSMPLGFGIFTLRFLCHVITDVLSYRSGR